jgi:4-amino-4-deoxy-L-arabinose transferase-like glycosyltransferase
MSGRRLYWLLLVVAALPYFVNLGATSIIDANEAFYTETPREMLETGDYLNSTFNYEPRFNKPPLSYWVVLGSYKVFGVSLWSARLPIALGALVIVGTALMLGRVAFSPAAGWIAAISLAATPRFLLFARRIIIDVYSAMFLGLALLCFVLAETDPPRRRRWLVLMYVATGLGILTKGPVAIVIPGLVFPLYLLATGRLASLRRAMLPTGVLIVAAIALPYYAALYVEHGWEYITTFLLRENLARYTEGAGVGITRGPLFYLPVVFADFYFPWSLVLPVALTRVPWRRLAMWRPPASGGERGDAGAAASPADVRLLLGLWIAVIVAFFSFSRGQQDLYVLPFVPAAAALVGGVVAALLDGTASPALARWTRGALVVMAALLAVLGLAALVFFGWANVPVHLAGGATAGVVLFATAAAAAVLLARRAYAPGAVTALVGVAAVLWVMVVVGLPDFERYKPVPRLAAAIVSQEATAVRVGTYRVATPSLVFYLQRHIDQMFDERQLQEFLAVDEPRYCVIRDTDYRAVRDLLQVRTRIVASAPRLDTRLHELFQETFVLPELLVITADGR